MEDTKEKQLQQNQTMIYLLNELKNASNNETDLDQGYQICLILENLVSLSTSETNFILQEVQNFKARYNNFYLTKIKSFVKFKSYDGAIFYALKLKSNFKKIKSNCFYFNSEKEKTLFMLSNENISFTECEETEYFVYKTLADCYLGKQNYKQAFANYSKAIAINPMDIDSAFLIIDCLKNIKTEQSFLLRLKWCKKIAKQAYTREQYAKVLNEYAQYYLNINNEYCIACLTASVLQGTVETQQSYNILHQLQKLTGVQYSLLSTETIKGIFDAMSLSLTISPNMLSAVAEYYKHAIIENKSEYTVCEAKKTLFDAVSNNLVCEMIETEAKTPNFMYINTILYYTFNLDKEWEIKDCYDKLKKIVNKSMLNFQNGENYISVVDLYAKSLNDAIYNTVKQLNEFCTLSCVGDISFINKLSAKIYSANFEDKKILCYFTCLNNHYIALIYVGADTCAGLNQINSTLRII